MDETKFFDSSPAAKQVLSRTKYPWTQVPVGKSFPIPKANISLKTLRSLASKTGKDLGKRFRVIDHDGEFYEVARLPVSQEEALPVSNGVVELLSNTGEKPNES